jgi:iron complex outermembrane recepter protein
MHRNRTSTVSHAVSVILSAAALGGVTGQAAVAQEAAANTEVLDEVVVTTARQREEALQDVPASVTAITSATLEQAAVERAGDFIRLTPGVSLVQTAEVADAQVNIRGINGARDAENSFALIIDGILMTNPAAFNREYSDLKQIEILKGPQGALYGRNAAAGAIIVTTTKPGSEYAGDVKLSYGEDATYTGQFFVGGPVNDRIGWKLGADYRSTDGFYKNRFVDENNVDDFEGWNVNGRLVWDIGDNSTLDIKAHYGEVDAASISFNAAFQLPGFAAFLNQPLFNVDVNDHNFEFVNNIDPFNEQSAADLSVKFDHDFGSTKLTAWALYSDVENAFGSDGTSGAFGFFFADPTCIQSWTSLFNAMFPFPAPQGLFAPTPGANNGILGAYTATACDGTQYQERNQTDYSFEIRLASSGDSRFRWLGGLYYLNIDREVGVNTGIDRGQGITRSLFAPAGSGNPTEALVWDNFQSDVYAVFGNIAYDINDDVELAIALRYDNEKREVTNLIPINARTQYIDFTPDFVASGMAPLNPALAVSPGGIPDQERTFSQIQPRVSLKWEVSEDFTTYANWGIGFKSGGFNNLGSGATVDTFINCLVIPTNNCAGGMAPGQRSVLVRDFFDKETSSAFEIGAKATLGDGRFTIEGAIYDTTVDDMQFFEFLVGQFGLLRVVNNIDEVKLQGIELGFSAKVTDELRLVGGFNRTLSEIKENSSRPNSVGNESPYTPDYTATAGVELNSPVGGGGWRVQTSAYWNLVGPTWFHVIQGQDNPTLFGVPGNYTNSERDKYSTIDARVAMANDHWTVALVAKNLGDEKFLQEVIPAPEFGGDFIHPGSERRLSFEVGYKF